MYPTVESPGFKLQSISVSTIVHFFDYPKSVIKAYIDNGEGIDRAGGFAIQVSFLIPFLKLTCRVSAVS